MMSRKDGFLALLVVVVWGLNFVVIKVGLHHMPPLLLAGLRFLLVAFPAIFFVARPKVPLTLLLGYGLTISFGQFAFLFCAIKFGMPAGLASLVLQAQAFFTMALGAFVFSERLQRKQLAGIALAIIGVLVLIEASLNGQHIAMSGFMLTLAAAFSWACGNIFNKKIMQHSPRPAVMSLVVWSALIPILPFLLSSLLLEGADHITQSLITIDMTTILSLLYLAFVATILGYGIWGALLGRYETWRVAPLSLLVPVVGLASAAVLLGETLTGMQLAGAVLIMAGLYINVFGFRVRHRTQYRLDGWPAARHAAGDAKHQFTLLACRHLFRIPAGLYSGMGDTIGCRQRGEKCRYLVSLRSAARQSIIVVYAFGISGLLCGGCLCVLYFTVRYGRCR